MKTFIGFVFALCVIAISAASILPDMDESTERSNRSLLMSAPDASNGEFVPDD